MAISITPSPFGSVTVTLDGEVGGVLSVSVLATSNSALDMAIGTPGPAGEAGEPGSNGQGVAPGGLINQVLVKLSNDDFDTGWADGGAGGDFLPLAGGTMSGTIFLPSLRNLLNTDLTVTAYNDTGAGTNFVHTFDAFDGTFALATNGGGLIFPDETVQTTAGLPLTGGTMTGAINYGAIDEFTNNVVLNSGGLTVQFDYNNYRTIVEAANISMYEDADAYRININPATGYQITKFGTVYSSLTKDGITFPDETTQTTAFLGYTGTSAEYIDGSGDYITFPPLGDRYFTTSNSTLTCDSGNGKTMTIGTGLSYSRQQDITVSYNNSNHMHGTVLTYDPATGVMTFDSNTHSGSGTFSSWEVNVGGVAGAILPVGGTNGQVLAKINSTNFNTEWLSLGTMSTEPASAYLSTASAVANYLTISSAASTYQTQSGMSAYLSTASAVANYQTISGMSAYLSTSAAASTYQTQSGMSAYLSTASASANFIGTSAYATTAQAQAGTSTTTVVSPATLLDAKFFQGGKSLTLIAWSNATSGTGSVAGAKSMNARIVSAPTSATGYGESYGAIVNTSRGGAYNSGIDWSKRVVFGGRFSRNVTSPDTNSVFRYTLGRFASPIPSDILATDKQVGIKVSGTSAMQLMCANGSALATVTSSFTPSNASAFDVVVTSDGAGNVALYVNGSSVATSTGGPTSTQGAFYNNVTFEAQNTSTISGGAMSVLGTDFFAQVNA